MGGVYFEDFPKLTSFLNRTLKELVEQLSGSSKVDLRASIIEPLENGSMQVLEWWNIPSGVVGDFAASFRWGDQVVGIAGRCVTERKAIFIPDLRDTSNPYQHDWIEIHKFRPSGGIVAIPIPYKPLEQIDTCLAVLCLTSVEYNFFCIDRHLLILQEFAHRIEHIIRDCGQIQIEQLDYDDLRKTRYVIINDTYNKIYDDDIMQKESDEALKHVEHREISIEQVRTDLLRILEVIPSSQRTRLLLSILNSVETDEDINQLDPAYINSIFEETSRRLNEHSRRPVVRIQKIWATIRGRENDIVAIDDFVKHFDGSANSENDARTAISWINRLFEKYGFDIRIDHVTAYRLRRASRKHAS